MSTGDTQKQLHVFTVSTTFGCGNFGDFEIIIPTNPVNTWLLKLYAYHFLSHIRVDLTSYQLFRPEYNPAYGAGSTGGSVRLWELSMLTLPICVSDLLNHLHHWGHFYSVRIH